MNKLLLLLLSFIFSLCICNESKIYTGDFDPEYFQQHVAYDITATLDDSLHTLSAYERIVYTNNSPDTLNYIWFHLWPNAYKNNESAFAKQRERFYSKSMIYAKEKERGYIDSLDFKVDGEDVTFEFHPEWNDVAKLNLSDPLFPGQNITIETPFFLKIPKVYSRLGHSGKHYEMTQWFPKPAVYDHKGWHPMPYLDMGEFYSEFGSFNVIITLPEEYRVMATGDLIDGEKEYAWLDSLSVLGDSLHSLDEKEFKKAIKKMIKGKTEKKSFFDKLKNLFFKEEKKEVKEKPTMKTLHFYQDKVHDFAWFADPKWIVRKGTLFLSDSTRKVTLWSMYLPKNAEQWENSIEYLHDSGYWYSEFYGDYPYNHITAVDGDMSAGGGMEYPNITVISEMSSKHLLEMVIMHEVGHNWFYGILGTNERDHAWMDEGINEFSNIRYWDKKYGKDNMRYIVNEFSQEKLGPFSIAKNLKFGTMEYMGYSSWVQKGDEEALETSSDSFKQPSNYWLSYSKPMLFSWHLLHFLGEDTIDNIMQNYYSDWKFKHPYPEDYFSYFSKYSDKNLDWYTNDVFYKTGIVDYSVCIKDDKAIFRNNGTLTLPFEVGFYDWKGTELGRQWFENIDSIYSFYLPNLTKSVILDPDQTLPDVNRANNATHKPITFTWIFDNPKYYKTEIYWMPWLFQGNLYNGFTPGLNFFHGNISGYNYGISFRPMWDFKNNEAIGSLNYNKTLGSIGNYSTSKIKMNISKNAGRSGAQIEFNGSKKEHLAWYPIWESTYSINYHDIQKEAVDTVYYTDGQLSTGYAELLLHNKTSLFLEYYLKGGLLVGLKNSDYLRYHLQLNLYYDLSEKIKTKLRVWVGGFLKSKDIPNQYLTYLSGSIDPDFENNSILNRTENINDVSIGIRQYDVGGPSMHGIVLDEITAKMKSSNKIIASANYEMNIPKIPGKIFTDIAFIEGDKTLMDLGWKQSLGPISLIIPLYQSWDKQTYPEDEQWIIDRIRFSLSVSNFNVRNLF